MKTVCFIIIFASFGAVIPQYLTAAICEDAVNPSNSEEVHAISFKALIANPKQYDGKLVKFNAYYSFGFELSILVETINEVAAYESTPAIWFNYVNNRDLETSSYWNNLLESFTACQTQTMQQGDVEAIGLFQIGRSGHMGMFPYKLTGFFICSDT